MKKQFLGLVILCAIINFPICLRAQCTENPNYKDLVDWMQNSSHSISAQVTIINKSKEDGSHYYTAWGKENLIYTGPIMPGGPKLNRCRFTTVRSLSLLFSDREQTFIGNLLHPFSINQIDKQKVSIDLTNNTIISESVTWNFTTTYTNVIRNDNIFYAFSGGSMIILNLRLVDNTIN